MLGAIPKVQLNPLLIKPDEKKAFSPVNLTHINNKNITTLPDNVYNRLLVNKKAVSFGSTEYKERISDFPNINNGQLNHSTWFFREGINKEFASNIIRKFPNGCQIYNYACSDGSEPYSLALLLIKELGYEEAKKRYFPIIAKDIGPEIIKEANQGLITLNLSDKFDLDRMLKSMEFKGSFVLKDKTIEMKSYSSPKIVGYHVPDKLRECVKFSVANILNDAKDPKAFESEKNGPSMLLFRNAMYHLKRNDRKQLLDDLYQNPNFEKGSFCDFYNPYFDESNFPSNKFTICEDNFEVSEQPHSLDATNFIFQKN